MSASPSFPPERRVDFGRGFRSGGTISQFSGYGMPVRIGKPAKRPFGQHRVAIFPDLLDLPVLQPKHQTIVVVVAGSRPGDVVAPRLAYEVVTIGDEAMGDRARPLEQQRTDVTVQVAQERLLACERARPRILAGYHPLRVIGETGDE